MANTWDVATFDQKQALLISHCAEIHEVFRTHLMMQNAGAMAQSAGDPSAAIERWQHRLDAANAATTQAEIEKIRDEIIAENVDAGLKPSPTMLQI